MSVGELEAALQPFGEFILKARLTGTKAAPSIVGWMRRFLTRPATDEPLADQVRRFREDLERAGACQDSQVRQAEQALRLCLIKFLGRSDWHRGAVHGVLDPEGRTDPSAALEQLRSRLGTRHHSYRTPDGPTAPTADLAQRLGNESDHRLARPAPVRSATTLHRTLDPDKDLLGVRAFNNRGGPIGISIMEAGSQTQPW